MNYLGSKFSLLPFIQKTYQQYQLSTDTTFCDLFSGTGVVGAHFRNLGFQVVANDIQTYAYFLNKVQLEYEKLPTFKMLDNLLTSWSRSICSKSKTGPVKLNQPNHSLLQVFEYLNQLKGIPGFIFNNYSPFGGRYFYTEFNAKKIDHIREKIEDWFDKGLVTDYEYTYLIASLLEAADSVANTACVYEAYLKKFKPSARKPLLMRPFKFLNTLQTMSSEPVGKVYQSDALQLVQSLNCDILYLDPPYNSRQYSTNYHILETIACKNEPMLKGVAGIPVNTPKSLLSQKKSAKDYFSNIIKSAKTKHILVSYNNEGIISSQDMVEILSTRGTPVLHQIPYARFKADLNRTYKATTTTEYLYYVRIN